MSKVFEYAEKMVVLNMPLKQRKVYVLTQMIEELRAYIEHLVNDGFSAHGDLVMGLQKQLISFVQLRGDILKC